MRKCDRIIRHIVKDTQMLRIKRKHLFRLNFRDKLKMLMKNAPENDKIENNKNSFRRTQITQLYEKL